MNDERTNWIVQVNKNDIFLTNEKCKNERNKSINDCSHFIDQSDRRAQLLNRFFELEKTYGLY